MGIYSTMKITRDDAQRAVLSKVFSMTDEQLENVMFDLYAAKTYNNFQIVAEYEELGEDDDWPIQFKGNEHKFQ